MADEKIVTNEKREPQVRVVDRRWWARERSTEEPDVAQRKPTYVEQLERQLADQATHLQTIAAEHRRSQDEFEQARVRLRRDVAREVERGKRAILFELLEVLDNLDRAIAAAEPSSNPQLVRGVELVRDQFRAKLQGFGVTRVEAMGHPFDATRHEAVTTTPVEDPAQDGIVVAVLKEGYAIGDDVLRPAAVVVGRR